MKNEKKTDENNNFPSNNSSEPREQTSSSFKRSVHLAPFLVFQENLFESICCLHQFSLEKMPKGY